MSTPLTPIQKGAVISDCGKYRYQLWRIWDDSKPKVLFVMHNPSKADAEQDDPTIRRCIGFAKSWGYGGIYVGNLSPYRATNPADLLGKDALTLLPFLNVIDIMDMIHKTSLHVLAYGNPVIKDLAPERSKWSGIWHYLKLTKAGNPCHPLYLKSDLTPQKFQS